MANRFLNNIRINDSYTLPSADGSVNQVITTDGAGNLSFIDVNSVIDTATGEVYYTVKNSTGSTLSKGKAVMAVGSDGNSGHILVDEMIADGSIEPKYFLGVLAEDIGNGNTGKAIHFGQIDQFDTRGQNGETWNDGDILWCDPDSDGDFTITEPDGPNVKIAAAIVLNASTNGKIQVRVQANEGIHDLHDTKITSQVDGDVLVWDNTTGVWFNDSTLNVDYTNSRVGVGTNDPTETLDIRGSVKIGKDGTSPYLTFDEVPDSSSGSEFYLTHDITGNILKFTDDNSNDFIAMDRDNGNVGIGTTSPQVQLHVAKNSPFPNSNAVTDSNTGFVVSGNDGLMDLLSFDDNTSVATSLGMGRYSQTTGSLIDKWGLVTWYDTGNQGSNLSDRLAIHYGSGKAPWGNSEKLCITREGFVGIGTTGPGEKLHVAGNLILNNAGEGWIKGYDDYHSIKFRAGGTNKTEYYEYGGTLAAGLGHKFFTGGTNQTLRLQIANDGSYFTGNVGIGESNPSHKLDVYTNTDNGYVARFSQDNATGWGVLIDTDGTSNNDPALWVKNATNSVLWAAQSGNVGIGTTSPLNPLSIESDSSPLIKIRNTTNGGGAAIEFNDNGASAANQNGRIKYVHSDGASQGGGSSFILEGEEDQTLQVLNNGRIVVQKTGSSAEVGYGFYNDVNTGMYSPGADTIALATGGNNRLHINSSGYVGIGTTSPDTKLEVNGAIKASVAADNYAFEVENATEEGFKYRIYNDGSSPVNSNTFTAGLYHNTQENAAIHFYRGGSTTGGFMTFTTNSGSERMRITSSGNVGIGTTSPSSLLHLESASSPTLQIKDTTNNVTFKAYAQDSNTHLANVSNHDLFIDTNNTARITVKSSGNVGIGTTSPAYKLDVNGGAGVALRLYSSADQQLLLNSPNSWTGIGFNDGAASGTDYIWHNGVHQTFAIGGGGSNVSGKKLHVHGAMTVGSGLVGTAVPTDGLLVQGNVGIGTGAPPEGRFEVQTIDSNRYIRFKAPNGEQRFQFYTGGTGNAAAQFMYDSDGTTRNVQISAGGTSYFNAGNVGIGTTSPSEKLIVNGSINSEFQSTSFTSGNKRFFADGYAAGNLARFGALSGSSIDPMSLAFYTSNSGSAGGSEKMRITDSGNVGIGTTSPDAKLDVSGAIKSSHAVYNDINGTRLINPGGGSSNSLGNSNTVGAIKIALPQSWTSTMMRMTIKVYEYSESKSFTINCGGYNHGSSSSWKNEFAYIESQSEVDRNFTVRFGYDSNNKCCIYIGELDSVWQYPKVFVTDFQAGFNNTEGNKWDDGWSVSMETTAFENVSQTRTNCQVNNWKRNGSDLYYGSVSGNVGIGTTTPSEKLDVVGNIELSGNVIDASSAAYYLDLNGTSQLNHGYFFSSLSFGGFSAGTRGTQLEGYSTHSVVRTDSERLDFYMGKTTTGVGTMMSLTDTGRVGIGTTNPIGKLHLSTGTTNGPGDTLYIERPSASNYSGISFATSGSVDWSIGHNSAGGFSIYENGQAASTRFIIKDGGDVGIGTTNPQSGGGSAKWLSLNGTAAYSGGVVYTIDSTTKAYSYFESDYLKQQAQTGFGQKFIVDGTNTAITILSDGNVGIGITNPQTKLHVANGTLRTWTPTSGTTAIFESTQSSRSFITITGANESEVWFGDATAQAKGRVRYENNNNMMEFWTSASPRMYIDSAGDVGIGAASPSYKLDVSGTIRATGDVIAFSDERVKENIHTIENALDKVNKLRGVEYNKIGEDKQSIGVIAQEVEKILPQAVYEDEEGMKSVAYGNMVGVLIEAIKEQNKIIENLKKTIDGITK